MQERQPPARSSFFSQQAELPRLSTLPEQEQAQTEHSQQAEDEEVAQGDEEDLAQEGVDIVQREAAFDYWLNRVLPSAAAWSAFQQVCRSELQMLNGQFVVAWGFVILETLRMSAYMRGRQMYK